MESSAPDKGTTVRDAAGQFAKLLSPQTAETQKPEDDNTPSEAEATLAPAEVDAQPTEETPTAQEQPTYKIRVDGEELEVPLDDLLRGYSRTSDYTRKTQKLSEERKALEAEAEQVRVERQHYAQTLTALKAQLSTTDEPDWQKLLSDDPLEYVRQDAVHRARKERLAAIESEQHRLAQQSQVDQQKALQVHVQSEEQKLHAAIPEWSDAKKAKFDREAIVEYAHSVGFSDAELSTLYDHRAVIVMREAALYRKMVNGAKQKIEANKGAPRTARPGNMQQRVVNKDLAAAKGQFEKTPNVKAAGAVLNRLLAPKPKGI